MTKTPAVTATGQIAEGYTLALIGPDGTVVDTFDVGGYDLEQALPAMTLGLDIMEAARG
jgi:hypothetical protein